MISHKLSSQNKPADPIQNKRNFKGIKKGMKMGQKTKVPKKLEIKHC